MIQTSLTYNNNNNTCFMQCIKIHWKFPLFNRSFKHVTLGQTIVAVDCLDDYYIIDSVTTIDAVVVLAVIGLLMVWRNDILTLLFLLVQLLFCWRSLNAPKNCKNWDSIVFHVFCCCLLVGCFVGNCSLCLLNVWHPVSFFKVNSFRLVMF